MATLELPNNNKNVSSLQKKRNSHKQHFKDEQNLETEHVRKGLSGSIHPPKVLGFGRAGALCRVST
jgi:hypothetical protein